MIVSCPKYIISHCAKKKWSKDLSLPDDYNWREIFKHLTLYTKDTSLFWFQYRIAHRILGVNKYLYFSKITDSQTCALCKLEPETLLHLFFECTKVKQIWLDLEHWIEEKSGKVVIFSPSTVILGTLEKDIGLNIIILLVKKYIYQTSRKRRNILFNDVRTYISNYYNVEKKLYQHISFEKRWSIWESIFNNNS